MGRSFPAVGAPIATQTLMEVLAEAPTIPPLPNLSLSRFHLLGLAAFSFSVWLIILWLTRRHQLQHQDYHLDLELEPGGATVVQNDSPRSPKPLKNPITSLPAVFDYEPPSGASPETCTVCTEDAAAGEKVRRLPRCSHVFHRDCIDPWLACTPTCPTCRSDVEEAC